MPTHTFNTELLHAWVEMCNKEGRIKRGEQTATVDEFIALQALIASTLAVLVQTSTVSEVEAEDPLD